MTRLRAARASAGGTPVQWHGFAPEVLIPMLESLIEFQGLVAEADRRALIRDALHRAATEAKFDQDALVKELKASEDRYLRRPLQKFIVATSWTALSDLKMKQIRLRGTRVSFAQPGRTRFNREPIQHLIEQAVPCPIPEMLQVQAHVSARTASAAFELGLHSLDYARGVLNFLINRRTAFRLFTSGPQKPVNEILPGPMHTVHTPRCTLALETVWYELYRIDQIQLFRNDHLLHKLETNARKIRQWVKESAYAADIEHAFVRYTRALDTLDHAVAFARLWTTIEYLADTSDHDKLMRRITFLNKEEERGFIEVVLRHLRDVRNGVVHVDASRQLTDVRGGMEAYLYHLKIFADWLIRFHLSNGRRYKTRAAAAELLDTPTDGHELRRLIKLYQQVLRRRS